MNSGTIGQIVSLIAFGNAATKFIQMDAYVEQGSRTRPFNAGGVDGPMNTQSKGCCDPIEHLFRGSRVMDDRRDAGFMQSWTDDKPVHIVVVQHETRGH